MLYLKIGEEKYPIEKMTTFSTQMGNVGVRIVGDTPIADGFLVVDEDDNTVGDFNEFTYLYRESENVKEYTKAEDEVIPTESHYIGDIPTSAVERQIRALNNRVSAITPVTMSKDVYIGNTECTFETDLTGDISAYLLDADGDYIPCTVTRSTGRITVEFDPLEQVGTVNVSIM